MDYTIHPVILCGGAGTRLWPLSTPRAPKQYKALTSHRRLIVETVERIAASTVPNLKFAQPVAVGALEHEELLRQCMPHARKILEPFGPNSAPAVAAACLASQPDQLMLVSPADQAVQNVNAFHQAIARASKAAATDSIVTFGIRPTRPETEYGYLKANHTSNTDNLVDVEEFVEKPDLAAAQSFLRMARTSGIQVSYCSASTRCFALLKSVRQKSFPAHGLR